MRVAAIILIVLGVLALGDQLLGSLAAPAAEAGLSSEGSGAPQWAGPAVMLVAGLALLRKAGSANKDD
jgi:hypothetical protein